MRKWVRELLFFVALLVFGPCVGWMFPDGITLFLAGLQHMGIAQGHSVDTSDLTRTLAALVGLLSAMVVSLIRWQRSFLKETTTSIHHEVRSEVHAAVSDSMKQVHLSTVFPRPETDIEAASMLLDLTQQHFRRLDGCRHLQRVYTVLARDAFTYLGRRCDEIVAIGTETEQLERSELYCRLMEGRSSFHTIERVPMSNLSGWSSGFVDFAERLGKSQTVQHRKYTLLCPPGVAVSGDPKKPSQRTDPNRPVDGLTRLKELHAFLKPIHFELRYVDESKMSPELLRPIASDEYMIVIDNEFAVVGKTPPTFQGTRLIVRARELTQTEPLRTLVDALSSARRIDEKALTKWTKAAWVTG